MADKKKPIKTENPKKPVKKFFNMAGFKDLTREEKDKILNRIIDRIDGANDLEPEPPTEVNKANPE